MGPLAATERSPTGTASMDRPLECSMDPRLEKSTLFASQSQESISSLVELTKELSFGIMMKVSATTMVQVILETSLRLVYPLTRRLLSQLDLKVPFSCGTCQKRFLKLSQIKICLEH